MWARQTPTGRLETSRRCGPDRSARNLASTAQTRRLRKFSLFSYDSKMRTPVLARDAQAVPFAVPAVADAWKVSRSTGGRPSGMDDPEVGGPLFIPISATVDDLIQKGCSPGIYFLEAVDKKRKPLHVRRAVVVIQEDDTNTADEESAKEAAAPRAVARAAPPSMPVDAPPHHGYTRLIEAMARQTTDTIAQFVMMTNQVQSQVIATQARLCALLEQVVLSRSTQAGVRDTIQTMQTIRNAAPELIPSSSLVGAPPAEAPPTTPESVILQGLGSVMGIFSTPAVQAWVAKKAGVPFEEILAFAKANGAAPAGAHPPGTPASASTPPPPGWPPELEPILAELASDERAEALEILSSLQASPQHIEQILAELRAYPTLAAKVAHTRTWLAFARSMRAR